MGLYSAGKTAAKAAIVAAVNARISTSPDGFPILDWPSLAEWLVAQAELIIAEDVILENRDSARGVLNTVDIRVDSERLISEVQLEPWREDSEYPSAYSVSSSEVFRGTVASAKSDLEARAKEIEDDYQRIREELPTVLSKTYSSERMADSLPQSEERILDTRYYVQTYVNDLGWESSPSPISDNVLVDQAATVNVSIPTEPYFSTITKKRIYRSNTGTSNAAFQLVKEVAGSATTVVDDVPTSNLNDILETTTWLPPNAKMRGIVAMPNGIIAGHFGNTVAFCEPFHPYAWPVGYQISIESPVIALGVFDQTLAVFHLRGVDYISGADSASMSHQKNISQQTCVNPDSVVNVDGGVVFSSPDSLCIASSDRVRNITENRILREDWAVLGLDRAKAFYAEGTVYLQRLNDSLLYSFHMASGKISTVVTAQVYTSFHMDRMRDAAYAASGTSVYRLFQDSASRTGKWKSKIMVLERQAAFAWLSIESDFSSPITVNWYGDGALRHTVSVSSRSPVRLPVGRWLEHEIEVISSARWNTLTMASSGDELRGI